MPSTVPHNPRWEVLTVPTSQRGTLRPGKWQMGDLRGPGPTLSGPGRQTWGMSSHPHPRSTHVPGPILESRPCPLIFGLDLDA